MTIEERTLKRLTNAIQWDVPVKKRTTPIDEILTGEIPRIDKDHITVVGVGDAVKELSGKNKFQVIDDNNDLHLDLIPGEDIAGCCVPLAPLKQWISTMNGKYVCIQLKMGSVLLRGRVDDIDIGCLVAQMIIRGD